MRSDLLSKRFFLAGFFGLPWLWVVHILYWRNNQQATSSGPNTDSLLNPDDHFQDETSNELTAEEIQQEAAKWVYRCQFGALISISIWIAWIVMAQLLRGSILPTSLYMLNSDNVELTGW